MAITQIVDIIEPSVFTPYFIQRTTELTAFMNSGIVSAVPEILSEMSAKGKRGGLINMPFWNDLDGDDEVLADNDSLTPAKIGTGQDIAVMLMRGKAWETNDLASALAGDDPMKAIGELVAKYWARRNQAALIQIVKGAMAASNMIGNVKDISGETGDAAIFSATGVIDACGLLGDSQESLSGMAVHGNVYTAMKKQDLIDFVTNSEQGTRIPYYMEKQVIVDDTLPTSGSGSDTIYESCLFGNGAIGYGEAEAPVATEVDRDSLGGNDILVTRRHIVLHPRGIKWKGALSANKKSPSNVELATADNWERVYENKNIKIVNFKHKL